MKSFIVAALLVAAVAGQSLDILKLNKEKSLLNKFERPIVSDLLLKKLGYPLEKTFTYGDNLDLPFNYYQDELLNKEVLQYDEILVHPLFREYINLPVFRQFWTYPAFQKYVTSTYFQRFWQIPAFKQYFINPVLFYKYIYPIVTLFKTDITIPTTYYGEQEIVNKNVFPVVTGFERDLLKDKLFVPTYYNQDLKFKDELLVKNLLTKIYSHLYNIPEEYVREQFPITGEYNKYFNKYTTYPVDTTFKTFDTTVYGDKIVKDELLKKMILNKMITGDKTFDTTVFGDKIVKDELLNKMLFNKMITGDKTFDTTVYGDKIVKDELLKKMLFNKMITGDKTFDTTVYGDKIVKDELLNKMLFNKMITGDKTFDTTVYGDKIVKDELLNKMLFNKMITGDKTFDTTVYGDKIVKDELLKKMLLNKMIVGDETYKTFVPEEYILREKMMKMNPVARMMYGFNKPIYTNKFDTLETVNKMNIFDINMKKDLIKEELLKKELIKNEILKKELIKDELLKKELIKEKMFDNVFDKEIDTTFGTYETVPKMVDFTTPMMKVKTFDKKMFPETIIKA